jgi:3'-5' exoribonuclease
MNETIDYDQNLKSDNSAIPILGLPWLYRIIHIERRNLDKNLKMNIAHLYHDKASIYVAWVSSKIDDRLLSGALATPRWSSKLISNQGQVLIQRLLPVEQPSVHINLLETIPYEWMQTRDVIQDAKDILLSLPTYFIQLFNAIFWDYTRFYRFLLSPSSLNGHHNCKHGNFIHTIEVAKNAMNLAENRPMVSREILLMATLLHDAGKADEYQFNYKRNAFEMSARGALIGHKLSIIEWVAAAIAQYKIQIPEQQYLALMHALTAVKGAPDWIGLREPVSPECHLLSMADRLSGHDDLFDQTKPINNGFGKFHKHLRGRAYLVNATPRK